MKKKLILTVFCAILFSWVSVAQEQSEDNPEIVEENAANLNILSRFAETSALSEQIPPLGNQVYIDQIGERNIVITQVNSNRSEVRLSQNGSDNIIGVSLRAKQINERISQSGDSNLALRYINDPLGTINFELIQNGGNQYIQHGANRLTNNLKIEQSVGDRGIIIRSFR